MNSTNTKSTDGAQNNIEQSKIEELKINFRGSLLPAGTHGYDQARKIWNGMFDKTGAHRPLCWDK